MGPLCLKQKNRQRQQGDPKAGGASCKKAEEDLKKRRSTCIYDHEREINMQGTAIQMKNCG